MDSKNKLKKKRNWEDALAHVKITWRELGRLAILLNSERNSYRSTVEELAGTTLQEWRLEDMDRYIELGQEKYLKITVDRRRELV